MSKGLMSPILQVARQLWPGVQRQLLAPHIMKMVFPGGLTHEAFDSFGHVKPWHLLTFLERNYTSSFYCQPNDNCGSLLEFNALFDNAYHFNMVCQLNVNEKFYDINVLKCPLETILKLEHVGKSSFTRHLEVKTPSVEDPLFSLRLLVVHADRDTRKSSPLPEWWTRKYKHLAEGKPLSFSPAKRPDDPEKIMSYPITVLAGDIDAYRHANFSSSLKYCLEGKVGAKLARGEKVTSRDLSMTVKSATVAYRREGNLGDRLSVDHWKGQEEGVWHFELTKEGQPMVQAAVELYDLDQKEAREPPSRL